MIFVQINEVYRALVGGDVLTVIVRQESFRDVVVRLHKGNNGELFFLTRSMSPALMTREFNFC